MPRPRSKNPFHVYNKKNSPYWWIWYWKNPDDKHPRRWRKCIATKYPKSSYTRDEVQDEIDRIAKEGDLATSPQKLTVGWLRDHIIYRLELEDRPEKTVRQYRNSLHYLESILGPEYDLKKIRRSIVWKVKEHGIAKGVSPQTINTRLSYLHAAFNVLVKEDFLEQNPFRHFERVRVMAQDRKHLTLDELKRFLSVVDEWKNEDARRLIRIIIYTGLRRQEVLLIERGDVDLANRRFKALNIKSRDKHKRWLPIHEKILEDFEYFLRTSRSARPFKRCHEDTLTQWVKKLLRLAGFPDHSTKSLRHTFATLSLEHGISIRELQRYLDHSDVRVSEIYAHDVPNQEKAPDIGI